MTSVAFTAAVVQWQAARVMKARKECGVAYPTLYAPGTDELATRFNCTQRAHQNSIVRCPERLRCPPWDDQLAPLPGLCLSAG